MRFFIGRQGQRLGPFAEQEIRDQLAAGAISPDDLVWREGLAAWQPVRDLFGDAVATAFTPPPLPHANARPTSHPQSARPSASHAFPAASLSPTPKPRLARREIRLVAYVLDLLVTLLAAGPGLVWFLAVFATIGHTINIEELAAGNVPIEQLSELVLHLSAPLLACLVPAFVVLVIQTWLLTTRGQTLGKKWLRIRIVRTDGRPADFAQVFLLRSMALQLVALIPVVGIYITLAEPLLIFREDRRCLHDLIAGTIVIDA